MRFAVLHPQLERRLVELDTPVELPVFPAVCTMIRRAVADPHLGAREVSRLVQKEPTLTLKVLKAANSPYYGLGKEVTSIQQAVSLLGVDTISDLALASVLAKTLPLQPGARRLDPDRFWGHSISVALMSEALARGGKALPESRAADAFTAGLVHDMGKPLMQKYWPVEYARALEETANSGLAMCDAERRTLGFTHQDMGAWLVDSWELPRNLVVAVQSHETPDDFDVSDPAFPTTAIVHVANLLVHFLQLGTPGDAVVPRLSAAAWECLGIQVDRVPDICESVRLYALELGRMLRA